MSVAGWRLAVTLGLAGGLLAGGGAAQAPAGTHWVGTWAAAPQAPPDDAGRAGSRDPDLALQTVRMVARISLGGSAVRVRFSNAFGTGDVRIGAARVAMAAAGAATVAGSDRALSFGGQPSITLPPGAEAISDALPFVVPPLARLSVTIYVAAETGPPNWHSLGLETAYIAGPGDLTAANDMPGARTASGRYWLSGIEVLAAPQAEAVVMLGDSITDGYHSTADADHRWPDVLADQLDRPQGSGGLGVLNEGISGNRILHDEAGPNALARFDRDVLAQDGVRAVVVLEGINDIGWPHMQGGAYAAQAASAADIIAGLRQVAERAHAHGLRAYTGTLTPFEGASYQTPEGEQERQAVNQWIRTTPAFDGAIDFDRVTRDPGHPARFLPAYDSGDHLHPNDAGYSAMGRAAALFFHQHP